MSGLDRNTANGMSGRPIAIAAIVVAAIIASAGRAPAAQTKGPIKVVGIESQYANVLQQIGGRYVTATAIETDPNVDPHSFEISPRIARRIAAASLIVENGLGYDGWAARMIASAPGSGRQVIDVQHLLGLPSSTPNPHLWYAPKTMPAVAQAVADDLARIDLAHAAYFDANVKTFDASLQPWYAAIASFKVHNAGTQVAVTEPVSNYLLQAMGADIETPVSLQVAIMNGTDPSPQDVAAMDRSLRRRRVKVLVYNQQVTDPLTRSLLSLARNNGIPVVGVYETMPVGDTYQSWMLGEVRALTKAVGK